MLTEYACTRRELSCIIGNLFTEIEPPCKRCGDADEITISGTTYTGSRAVLTVTRFGFTFDGDPAEVERIRERRCLIGEQKETGGANGICDHHKGERPCEAHVSNDE